jgi:N6-adenosine-specific RNA methylase IME4
LNEGSTGGFFEVRGEVAVEKFAGESQRWPFGSLRPFSYELIMADPAWRERMRSKKGELKSPERHYRTMTIAEIKAMPVNHLAAPDCVLFLWGVWPLMLHGGDPEHHFAGADASRSPIGEVMHAWGFRYVTGGAWHKKTRHGKTAFGPGYRARSSCEPFLLGIRGRPVNSRSERNLIEGLARAHSQKPEEAYAWCERYLPGARRAELFSRTARPGWDTWGDEAGKLGAATDGGAT